MFKISAPEPPSSLRRGLATAALVAVSAVVVSLVARLILKGLESYGWALFLGIPVLAGFIPGAALRILGAQTRRRCMFVGLGTGFLLLMNLLVFGLEGLICIAMAIPLELPLVVLGAELAYRLFHKRGLRPVGPGAAAIVAVLGLAIGESRSTRPAAAFSTADSVVIRATPARVWEEIVGIESVPAPTGLLLRTGVACPETVRIARPGVGGVRICTLSTGQVLEHIDLWQPGRRLQWTTRATPPPLTEVNPFRAVDAPHLHGFYEAFRGEFVLEPVGRDATRLTRRTWYRHNLQPSAYWRLWCDFAASQVHDLVLQELRRLAESGPENS